jgi:signal transduction histidine kinase
VPSPRTTLVTTWVDVAFGLAIGTMTEGVTGPSYPFFAFAVVVTGLRGGLRQTMLVTTISLALYTLLILVSTRSGADVYIMRPVYLGITGYVVGYLGQQRLDLQEEMRQLEVAEQRHRIARDLHDNYAQALAGIDLRLESVRRLLRSGETGDALDDVTALQDSVKREFDDLRQYARTLAGVEPTPALRDGDAATRVALRTDVTASVVLVEHVLGIVRESISNIRRHARAKGASIDVASDADGVHIRIDDDGVGFDGAVTPWSITSRVKEIGGSIEIAAAVPGAHLQITLPPA